MMEGIPIIDFSGLGIDHENTSNIAENQKRKVAAEICDAFTNIGFFYLKNHGISDEQVKRLMGTSRDFFEQPIDVKKKYAKAEEQGEYHGWIINERLSPVKPPDYKEAYNYKPNTKDIKEFSDFEKGLDDFYNTCTALGKRILDMMSLGLNLPKHIMQDAHLLIGKPGNPTTLRTLYYPPVINDLEDGQVRCGEHSDYGSITLLFQGEGEGGAGLQVRNVNNEFIPAKHIPGTVLVNIGDLMQHWTADKFVATKHRVVMPEDNYRHMVRQSLAFFIVPDDNALIESLDNSNKYEPVTSGEYIRRRFAKSME